MKIKPADTKRIQRSSRGSRRSSVYGSCLREFIDSNQPGAQVELDGEPRALVRAQLAVYAKRHKLPVEVFTSVAGEIYLERTDINKVD